MSALPHTFEEPEGPRFGLLALQTDETIEGDLRALLSPNARLHVSRVPNAREVTPETLGAMDGEIARAASLLPGGRYDGIVYGCTSASAVIGSERVATAMREGCDAQRVVDPLSALIETCRAHGVRRLGFVSPYVASVSDRLRLALEAAGIAVPYLASFEVGDDWSVVRIAGASVERAARDMAARDDVDAVFLSCTNLRTLPTIERMADVGVPVWSSNLLVARVLVAPTRSCRATMEALT